MADHPTIGALNRIANVANALNPRSPPQARGLAYYRDELWDALALLRRDAGIPGDTYPVPEGTTRPEDES